MAASSKVRLEIPFTAKKISPLLFGSFIENIAECIHNGIWSYHESRIPFIDHPRLDRIRRDLFQALVNLKPSLIRWPGGCFADVYNWKDGIGPREERKIVHDGYWKNWSHRLLKELKKLPRHRFHFAGASDFAQKMSNPDYNQFGTMEFLSLCEEIRALPYITVNYGSGSPEEAADWVEYCNGNPDTKYGRLRSQHGRKSPFYVPIWGIGNEIYLENEEGFEKHPSDYGKRYMEFARMMKERDPGIKLVGCGWNRENWNQGFLEEVEQGYIDYLSIHQYLPYPTNLVRLLEEYHPESESAYYAMMAAPFEMKKQILKAWNSLVKRFGDPPGVKVAFDEWGIWYTLQDLIKANYNLQDGLFAALVLMMFQNLSDFCSIGLWSMLVNSFGMIRTDDEGLILTPVYLVFWLFKEHTYPNKIEDISVETGHFDAEEFGQIGKVTGCPLVECSATCSDDGSRISVMLINKHFSDRIKVSLSIKGSVLIREGFLVELTSTSPFDCNDLEERARVHIREQHLRNAGADMTLDLSPHSITILKFTNLNPDFPGYH